MKNTFYVTTPIFYANDAPHMGHIYTTVLADIIARYHRMVGKETFFLTGTDEHGDKIIRSATATGKGPQAFVDANVLKFKELFSSLDISYDFFIRTSDQENHWPGAKAVWTKLVAAGDIYKGTYRGLYCVGCETFITEKELVSGKCPLHDTIPERIEEENYFFRLSKYTNEIREKIENGDIAIFPQARRNETLALLSNDPVDVSFSRPEGDIPWGIPVPNDNGQMIYVWCDALSNYLSALGFGRDDHENFDKFWPADVHVIGKDISRFHTVIWPAMLLSAGIPLPKTILIHGFITSRGKKMSKTIGNVVDPNQYIAEFGSDSMRYYLAREIPTTEDGDFTYERFVELYNANLANGLGNLVSRTLKMAERYFSGSVMKNTIGDIPLRTKLEKVSCVANGEGYGIPYVIDNMFLPAYHKSMESFDINGAMDEIWKIIRTLDGYIADYEPFKLIKTDKEKTENIIWGVLYGLYYVSSALAPVMPRTAGSISGFLRASLDKEGKPRAFKTESPSAPLFARK
ncbi:MAG: methionine--tRNA ligase [Candidatus Yonathbacteria bacterium CG_4_9_14_0_8_um_filter_46_47]|nr:MAG: methionine--tRNA ligase [Candidatus Yonathbacteria bacterium CG_4_9_14_0_8_um_filter_46_47]